MRTLDPKEVPIKPAEFVHQTWCIQLPSGYSYAAIFQPGVWVEVEKFMRPRGDRRPRRGDLVRIIGADDAFDVVCVVRSASNGYTFQFHSGIKPSGVAQVLDDLKNLPVAEELKGWSTAAAKRWKAGGVDKDDLATARRRYAKHHHPDAGAVVDQRLALANAAIDHALATLEAA